MTTDLGFIITSCFVLCLLLEPLPLNVRIVQLCVGIDNLLLTGKQLKPLS